ISRPPLPLRAAHQAMVSCEALSELLAKAMDKKPENRPQTMDQFREGLADAVRRDMIRLSSLKNRKSELEGSSTTQQQRIVPPAAAAAAGAGSGAASQASKQSASGGKSTQPHAMPTAEPTPAALAPIKVADIVRSDTLVDSVAALPQDQLLTSGTE